MSRGNVSAKMGHGSATELESKSSLFPDRSFHIDSDINFVHVIRIFECQAKCTSNLESALCIEFITVQILTATATIKLLKGSRNKIRQTKNIK